MQKEGQPAVKKERNSNLELYRVIVMLAIVASHYVNNSGLYERCIAAPGQLSSLLLLLIGAWGKTGINCFVMITGYFMCKSQISVRKFAKLYLEIVFYNVVIDALFVVTGYTEFSLSRVLTALVPFTTVGSNFSGCFLLFYLFIPFLSLLVRNLNSRQHAVLVMLALFVYSVLGSIPKFNVTFNYITWFGVLFMIASYIRLHPLPIFEKAGLWGWAFLGCFVLASLSVLAGALIGEKIGMKGLTYYFVADSNKVLAVAVGISSFLFFKNLKIPHNKWINAAGASTFGVLLIHTNSDTMRAWLWGDVINNLAMYDSPWLLIHIALSVVAVFTVCAAIDWIRIRFLETPFFDISGKYMDHAEQLLLKEIATNHKNS